MSKANIVLLREPTGYSKHPLLITRDDSKHGHHQMVNTEFRLIIFFGAKDGEAPQSAKTRPGADCCSHHQLLIAKFKHKLKKVGKNTRQFRYDQNQITYDYTLQVTSNKSIQGIKSGRQDA